ncbi:hypothetical protein HDU87_000251 [Geranomyces variabilis]|uniref:Uncharacterized protein n=1 Tax=Geranomyces variabilis TaxID=109894 RepID=A0AAD5TU68_9FUNG|nr:hypothetical protein HDU87_000251 [Geranomyces variabilis]
MVQVRGQRGALSGGSGTGRSGPAAGPGGATRGSRPQQQRPSSSRRAGPAGQPPPRPPATSSNKISTPSAARVAARASPQLVRPAPPVDYNSASSLIAHHPSTITSSPSSPGVDLPSDPLQYPAGAAPRTRRRGSSLFRRPSMFRGTSFQGLRRPSIFRGVSFRRVPVGIKTKVDYVRLFFYLSLFLVPYVLACITLIAFPIYQAPSVTSARTEPGRLEWDFRLFKYCYAVIDDGGATNTDPLVGYPSTQVCQSYSELCAGSGAVRFYTKFDPAPGTPDRTAFCGSRFRLAVGLEIGAAVAGAIAIVSFLDNILVWLNISLWYSPNRHQTRSVRTVRRAFKDVILICVALHMVLQCAAVVILFRIQNSNQVRWPTPLQFHAGFFLATASWIADGLFLILFMLFDKMTFFAVPVYEDGEEATGSIAYSYMRRNNV